ncbi:BMC domain-containing protein [Amycolatopsis sp. DSM 110486]|uniref:BMC domain-containing protein n=1 Tax=Amycolatopsis sp. DSM 110486 TaxID=2865832 RepID=UPI001C6A3621|nr:BMC domain-containing protein [Amycolatopsis sp. DSM 110486]QYN23212.1 BMC domain-containing protein [Amycolatopsis sp. DSM 110486]
MAGNTNSAGAIGVVETRGIVALTAGIEAMIKTADVRCIAVDRVSSGYLVAAIQGQLAAVRQALDAGTAAVKRYGDLRAAQIYPRPSEAAAALLETRRAESFREAVLELPSGGQS